MNPIVFLHIPKTAGQTIHSELTRVVGTGRVSPVRVHTQAAEGAAQFPRGYDLYSGHLDWDAIETLPEKRFVFTVLRDPRERLASFYFFLLNEAQGLSEVDLQRPERRGMRGILERSAEGYFFGDDPGWQGFIHDHWDNIYCSYFATRKMRGWRMMKGLDMPARVAAAQANLPLVHRIYSTRDLAELERDIAAWTGREISVVGKYINKGIHDTGQARWPKLLDRIESDANIGRLERFVEADEMLIERLGLTL